MPYCRNCGAFVNDGAAFCVKCGSSVSGSDQYAVRQQEYAGKVIKCPNCGNPVSSFVANCPFCGFEFRDINASSAVREFARKLEAIEATRVQEPVLSRFLSNTNLSSVSKTDAQKISLIQSFSVPNTKEDILEFMILASANVSAESYDSANTRVSKTEKNVSNAWLAKMNQVYEKAKQLYGHDGDFDSIQRLYDNCTGKIKKAKYKGIIKWVLLFGWMPLLFGVIFLVIAIRSPIANKKENARMESFYQEAKEALDNKEYKKALMYAENIVFDSGFGTKEAHNLESEWDIKRELLIDEILEKAKADGIILERSTPVKEDSDSELSENLDSSD